MKTIAVFFIASFSAIAGNAQKLDATDVPGLVKANFAKSFPKAKDVKWSTERAQEFEAEFKSDGKEMSANFKQNGEWTGTETEMKKSELPKLVLDAIAKEFAGYKVEEVEKAELPGKSMIYEVELEKGEVTYEVQFSQEGKVIKKEVKKGEKEEKD